MTARYVKGTAFLARQKFIVSERSADEFAALVAEVAAEHPVFADPVVATTRLPLDAFLALNDRIVERFYDGDETSYYRFGEASGEWGLTVGPYKGLVVEKSVRGFVASVPTIYRSYFNEGTCEARVVDENHAELRMSGITPLHLYFEFAVSGYFKRGLELVSGRSVSRQIVRGFSKGDTDVHHILALGRATA